MFPETAPILKEHLKDLRQKFVYNFGSGIWSMYHDDQKWIWEDVLEPLLKRDCIVVNIDMKEDTDDPWSGYLDLQHYRADITKTIAPMGDECADIILCTSTIEHIEDVQGMIKEMKRIIRLDGSMWIEAPAIYPIHHDPIDTGLRLKTEADCAEFMGPDWKIASFQTYSTKEPFAGEAVLFLAIPWGKCGCE